MTRFFALIAIALALCAASARAVPANSRLQAFAQPDGSRLRGYVRGDENARWLETADRRPMARGADGYFYYVSRYAAGNPMLDSHRADHVPPDDLDEVRPSLLDRVPVPFDDATLRAGPLSGKVLFILVDYADEPAIYTNPKTWANKLYDADVPSNRSVVDYYLEASQGVAELAPAEESHKKADNGVIGWLRLSGNHPNPGQYNDPASFGPSNSGAELSSLYSIFTAAVAAADPFIDYGDFDFDGDGFVFPDELAIVVVVSGYDQAASLDTSTPSLWPRRTTGAPIAEDGATLSGDFVIMAEIQEDSAGSDYSATIGTPVHELGHLIFGLPDLYDTDGDTDGIGPYGVMGLGCYGRDPAIDLHDGETPVLPDAWSLYKLGWAEAGAGLVTEVHSSGRPLADGAIDPRLAIGSCDDGLEYFLAQYRTFDGYDKGLDASLSALGVLIFHVDEGVSDNVDRARRLVDVEEANDVDLSDFSPQEGNFWVDGSDDTFGPLTSPSSEYNDGTRSDVSMVVGAEYTVFTTKGGGVLFPPGKLVPVTSRCVQEWNGGSVPNKLP